MRPLSAEEKKIGNGQTLIALTYDVEGAQYQRNKQVLDRMIDSLELNAREVTLG